MGFIADYRRKRKIKKQQQRHFGLDDLTSEDAKRYLEKYAETFKKLGE